METIKIQISEVEGMSVKIPTEFTAKTFNDFYIQMSAINRIMPTAPFVLSPNPNPNPNPNPEQKVQVHIPKIPTNHVVDSCPDRLRIGNWSDKKECLELMRAWNIDKKRGTIAWLKRHKGWELTPREVSKVSQLIGSIRQKYRKEWGL